MATVGGTYSSEIGVKANAALIAALKAMYSKPMLAGPLVGVLVATGALVGTYVWTELRWPAWVLIDPWFPQLPWYGRALGFAYNVVSTCLFGALLFALAAFLACRAIEKLRPEKCPPGSPIGSDYVWPRQWQVTLTPEAYTSEDCAVKLIVKWPGVDALYLCGDFWAFILSSRRDFVDRRAFADAAAERAFIAEALSHLSAEARARSAGAVKFAGV